MIIKIWKKYQNHTNINKLIKIIIKKIRYK